MFTMGTRMLLIYVSILSIFKIGNGFQCYKCTTDEVQECWKVDHKDTFQKVLCTSEACLTVQLPSIGGIERLARDCYSEEYCDKYSICEQCEEHLCNGSSIVNSFLILIIIGTVCLTVFG